jgi:hypothetical protein
MSVMFAVVGVWLTVIEQLFVFNVALIVMLLMTTVDAVCVTNTAVAACSTGTTSHQDVPSFPTTQSSADAWL